MLVYNAEIWPEYKVAHTKSDWTGFKITSDTIGTVISDVILKPVQSDLVCATLYSGQISAL